MSNTEHYCPLLDGPISNYECGEQKAQIALNQPSSDGLGLPLISFNVLMENKDKCLKCRYH